MLALKMCIAIVVAGANGGLCRKGALLLYEIFILVEKDICDKLRARLQHGERETLRQRKKICFL